MSTESAIDLEALGKRCAELAGEYASTEQVYPIPGIKPTETLRSLTEAVERIPCVQGAKTEQIEGKSDGVRKLVIEYVNAEAPRQMAVEELSELNEALAIGGVTYRFIRPSISKLMADLGLQNAEDMTEGSPTLTQMQITYEVLEKILAFALACIPPGRVPDYIKALAEIPNFNSLAVMVGDLHTNTEEIGDALEERHPIESVVKMGILGAALHYGISPEAISIGEVSSRKFSDDEFASKVSDNDLPISYVNNSGAICACIHLVKEGKSFEDILGFFKELTGNDDLEMSEEVFESEFGDCPGNDIIASFLHLKGVADDYDQARAGLKLYTQLCSLMMNASDVLEMGLTFAKGGLTKAGDRILTEDDCKKIKSAGERGGKYDTTVRDAQAKAGQSSPAKTGVGGFILDWILGRGAIVTLGHRLDSAGNDSLGNIIETLLYNLMASKDLSTYSLEELQRMLEMNLDREDRYAAQGSIAENDGARTRPLWRTNQLAIELVIDQMQKALANAAASAATAVPKGDAMEWPNQQ